MSLSETLRFIVRHPLNKGSEIGAIGRFVKWQIQSRISSRPRVVPFVNSSKLTIRRGRPASTGNLYTRLHEFPEMGFVLHLLRGGDVFVDVGANIGAYSILAASVNGVRCIAFEPALETFNLLRENITLNGYERRIVARRMAIGREFGNVSVTSSLDTVNHIANEADEGVDVEVVPVDSLDNVLESEAPAIIKIDVEGYETPVIEGAAETIASPGVLALIVEMNGSGERYGLDERRLENLLTEKEFEPSSYNPLGRCLIPIDYGDPAGNRIYIRDREAVQARLTGAPAFTLPGGLSI